jgi:hypothetical protein
MAEEGNAVGGKGSEIDFAVMTFLRRAAWPFCVCDFGPFARGVRHYSASITTSTTGRPWLQNASVRAWQSREQRSGV